MMTIMKSANTNTGRPTMRAPTVKKTPSAKSMYPVIFAAVLIFNLS